jgi:Uri superfamily endonuclease
VIPASPGSYILQLSLPAAVKLQLGRLGSLFFPAGEYLYFGSACGPGGLRARLERHWRGGERLHWHIDALRSVSAPRQAVYLLHAPVWLPLPPPECRWSQAALGWPGAFIPAPGFGASDCRSGCRAHLVGFPASAGSYLLLDLSGALARAVGAGEETLEKWESGDFLSQLE